MYPKEPLRFLFLLLFVFFSFTSIAQESPSFLWAVKTGGALSDFGRTIRTDASDNVYIIGSFQGTVDFDPGTGTFSQSSNGSLDFYIQKLDPNGNFIWAKTIGGTAIDYSNDLTIDASGNLYITGRFENTVDFDPGPGIVNRTTADSDVFVLKLDSNGNLLWVQQIGGTGNEVANGIITDNSGNVLLTGSYDGTTDLDPGAATFNFTSNGLVDVFVLKLDASGNFIWAKSMGGTGTDTGMDIAIEGGTNPVITGYFNSSSADYDPGGDFFPLTTAGDFDAFVVRLNVAGSLSWAIRIGGTLDDRGQSLVTDATGNVYTTGVFQGTVDFDPGAGTISLTSGGGWDVFISKLNSSAAHLWTKKIGDTANDNPNSITLDPSGNVLVTGSFQGTVDFNPGSETYPLSAVGFQDVFVEKLTTSGVFLWAYSMGAANADNGASVTSDGSGNIYVTGLFHNTVDFNIGSGSFPLSASGANPDSFVQKIGLIKTLPSAASSFDAEAEGWIAIQNGIVTPTYSASNGNPGGYISMSDLETGFAAPVFWYWQAPVKFLGNFCTAYGRALKFDLQQNITGSTPNESLVRLSNGSTTLYYFPATSPALTPSWTSYSVLLDETTGNWKIANSPTATSATKNDIKAVLCSMTSLQIRGEFNGPGNVTPDIGGLDNVILETLPSLPPPVITSFTPASAIPGSTLTITGTGFDPTPANNTIFFGAIQATVSSASATQLQVTVPTGARYGTITVLNNTTSLIGQSLQNFDPAFTDGGRIIPASLKLKQEINLGGGTNFSAGLALADVDNDGWVDIITTESAFGVSIFRNLGTGGSLTPASFAPKITLSQANGKLRVGDMDGDGRQDIAVLYAITFGYVTLYRNTSTPGSISFAMEQLQSPSTSVRDIQLTDLDDDGRLDLLQSFSNTMTPGVLSFGVWQGISEPGNIEFCVYKSFDLSSFATANEISIGDLNNDNKTDVIVVNNTNTQFHILENTSTYGAISFGTPFLVTGAVIVRGRVQVADFNNDNKLDLAWRSGGPTNQNDVRIRTNTNTGGALVAADFATELILQSSLTSIANAEGELAVADINGDGKPDILATDDNDFGIFENLHTGGALTANSFSFYEYQGPAGTTPRPAAPETADLNGDGRADIVFGTLFTGTQAKLVISENINTHTPEIALSTVSPLKGVIGSQVTITGNYFSTVPAENLVYFGPAKATVLTATKNTLTVSVPAGATHAPVGVTCDQLTAQYHLPFNVVFSHGTAFSAASFEPPVAFTLTGADLELDVADLNGDNKPEVVAEGTLGRSYAFRNRYTTGLISTASLIADDTIVITEPRLADLNGDSKPDLFGVGSIFRNNHTTGNEIEFNGGIVIGVGGTLNSLADFNLDGRTELAGTNGANASVHENQSREGFFTSGAFVTMTSFINYAKATTGGYTVAADFDNDGWQDMASTNPGADNFTVLRNNGGPRIVVVPTPLFTSHGTVATGDVPQRMYTGDLDSDKKMDLVVLYGSTGTSGTLLSVFRNQSATGTITFTRQDFTLANLAGPSAIADLDGDGKPEIVVTHEGANSFTILKNNSAPGTIDATSFTPASLSLTAPRAVAAGDINSDGRLDLIFTSAPNSLIVLENIIPKATISFTSTPSPTSTCEGSNASFSATATGDNNLVYQWQIDNGGFVDLANDAVYSGVNSNTLTITGAPLTLNGKSYRVLVHGDVTLNTASSVANLTVNPRPAQPAVTSSVTPVGTTISICSGDVTLTAPAGFSSYLWSTSATSQQITTSQAGSYTVQVTDTNGCTSIASSSLDVVINTALCNIPPVINPDTVVTQIEGKVNFDLSQFISDTDNNLDFSTLKIISQPTSGAVARIEGNNLIIDYLGKNFSGPDRIIIEICDLAGSCVQEEIIINVIGDIYVYNAVSPNNDAKNEFLFFQYIDALESTRKNHVSIFNRWGDKVYEADNYDNAKVKFEGKNNNGNDLPSGTYFFKIDFLGKPQRGQKTGYFSLKR
jgi:gliding motility-associated-like protein